MRKLQFQSISRDDPDIELLRCESPYMSYLNQLDIEKLMLGLRKAVGAARSRPRELTGAARS